MKKIIFLSLLLLSHFLLDAQSIDGTNIKKGYLNFIPSDVNPEDLRPADIPSEQVLRQMGLNETEISEALDFKYSRGKYADNILDTAAGYFNLSKFYQVLGDTLVRDTVSFPKGRIFGQDIFRGNDLDFYQKALDAKAPEHYKVGSGDEGKIF